MNQIKTDIGTVDKPINLYIDPMFILDDSYEVLEWNTGEGRGVLPKRYITRFGKTTHMDKTGRFNKELNIFDNVEPILEKIACEIAKLLNINCAQYELIVEDIKVDGIEYKDVMICRTLWFLDIEDEFISASEFFEIDSVKSESNKYEALIKVIPNIKEDLDNMLILDYLLGNSDRHSDNLGFIKDSKKNIYLAPVYDNGSCEYLTFIEESDLIDEETGKEVVLYNDEDYEELFEEITGINLMEHLDENFTCKFLRCPNYHNLSRIDSTKLFENIELKDILNIVDKYSKELGRHKSDLMKYSISLRHKELVDKFVNNKQE